MVDECCSRAVSWKKIRDTTFVDLPGRTRQSLGKLSHVISSAAPKLLVQAVSWFCPLRFLVTPLWYY